MTLEEMIRDASRQSKEEGLQEGLEIGIQKGLEKGKQEGLEIGVQKGDCNRMLSTVDHLLSNGSFASEEEA
ncbi:MAG: hypothetical protein IKS54_08025 [Erysipelotrichaceae bacterium]|nr:hypothetical protein [Erysipelotrichaceae bacterium]